MKKVFLSMLTAVALFASCSQEDLVSQTGGESMVSFTLNTPELASRAAAGDGTQATQLNYAVYDVDGNIVPTISTKGTTSDAIRELGKITAGTDAIVKLPLLNGETYSILFWAESAGETMVIVDWTKKIISTNETLTSNKESYDAFYAYVKPFVVTGNLEKEIDLYRPFAQLNIGTTQEDLNNAAEYYGSSDFTKSSIQVTIPTAMDLTTGNVSGEKTKTYQAATFLSENLKKDYKYLSMNYLLVSSEKSLIDVKFSCTNDTKTIDKTFKNVPVQRNYRTNIYGNLFTSTTDWNVSIESDFNDTEYNPAEQLAAVFEEGGEVTLYTDVELKESLVLPEGKTAILNLNGHSIINNQETGNFGVDEAIVAYGNLTIEGEGTVQSNSMAVWARGGNGGAVVTINGGTYKGLCEELAKGGRGVVYASSGNTININGGTFEALAPDLTSFANKNPGVYAALNVADNNGSINVKGGNFYKFNPAVPGTEPATWNDNHPNGFVAEGYTSVQIGDNYVVVKGTAVTTENFKKALIEGGDVTLVSDVATSETATLIANTNLDGANKTLFIDADDLSKYYTASTLRLITTSGNATIKNLTIDGNSAVYDHDNNPETSAYGIRGIFLTGEGTVTIDNVTIKNVTYCLNDDSSEKTLNVSNSTFEGWTSYNTKTTATFTNTSFKKGTYGTLRPYAETILVNCDFAEGFVVDVNHTQNGVEYQPEVKFVNCTYAGKALTEKTSALFESGDKMDKVTFE